MRQNRRSQRPRGLTRGSVVARLLGLWVRIPPGAWRYVSWVCCMLSGRGLWVWLITRLRESYQVRCVQWVCLWSPARERPRPGIVSKFCKHVRTWLLLLTTPRNGELNVQCYSLNAIRRRRQDTATLEDLLKWFSRIWLDSNTKSVTVRTVKLTVWLLTTHIWVVPHR